MKSAPVTIALVEDDPGHARLIEKNLRRAGLTNELIVLNDGQQALDFIFEEGACQGQPRPSQLLVLLDLNMPGIGGLQVLERLKADIRTQRIPVIVLTTTDDKREISKCYQLGCNLYVTKPVAYEAFAEAIRELGMFLTIVAVPDAE